MWLDFEESSNPRLRDPLMVVAVSTSMPQYRALYSQARELGDYMLRKMEFKKMVTIRSSAFPPEVLVRKNGVSSLPECSLYSLKGKKDLILFAGDTSPMEDQYSFAKALLLKAEEYGVKELYSIGVRWAENPLPTEADPEPGGFSTDDVGVAKLKRNGVKVLKDEPAPFFVSMVVAMAKEHGIRGYKLSVDHGEPSPHVRSVIKLLGVLSTLGSFEVDLEELKSKAKASAVADKPGNAAIYR
jgi:proteasome assembly chaperone (PAC2) family protein